MCEFLDQCGLKGRGFRAAVLHTEMRTNIALVRSMRDCDFLSPAGKLHGIRKQVGDHPGPSRSDRAVYLALPDEGRAGKRRHTLGETAIGLDDVLDPATAHSNAREIEVECPDSIFSSEGFVDEPPASGVRMGWRADERTLRSSYGHAL